MSHKVVMAKSPVFGGASMEPARKEGASHTMGTQAAQIGADIAKIALAAQRQRERVLHAFMPLRDNGSDGPERLLARPR